MMCAALHVPHKTKAPSCSGGTFYCSLKSLLYSVEIILRMIARMILVSVLLLKGRREKEHIRRSSWTGRKSLWSTPARDRCTALPTIFPFGPWTSATRASLARWPCTRRWRPRCWARPSKDISRRAGPEAVFISSFGEFLVASSPHSCSDTFSDSPVPM